MLHRKHYKRFVGLDIHKKTASFAIVNREGEILACGTILMTDLVKWAKGNLTQEDQVIIEATGNSYHVYDQLSPLTGEVQIAHMLGMHDRTCSRKKTDKLDAIKLARALASGYTHKVWVPTPEVRAKRELSSHRHALSAYVVSMRNQLRSILYRHGLEYAGQDILDQKALEYIERSSLPETSKQQWRSNYRIGQSFLTELHQLDKELAAEALKNEQCLKLMTMPGIKAQAALIITSAIGDVARFDSPKKLTSYSGLVPSVVGSGDKVFYGGITKQGRSLLRWIMVEVANASTMTPGPIQDRYHRFRRKGKTHNVAIVAIARHLLEIIWQMLKDNKVFKHARPKYLVFKFRSLLHQAYGRCPQNAAPRLAKTVMGWKDLPSTA
jgi:transposase